MRGSPGRLYPRICQVPVADWPRYGGGRSRRVEFMNSEGRDPSRISSDQLLQSRRGVRLDWIEETSAFKEAWRGSAGSGSIPGIACRPDTALG